MKRLFAVAFIPAVVLLSQIGESGEKYYFSDRFLSVAMPILVDLYHKDAIEFLVVYNVSKRESGYPHDSTLVDMSMYDSTIHISRGEFARYYIHDLGPINSPLKSCEIRSYSVDYFPSKLGSVFAGTQDSVWLLTAANSTINDSSTSLEFYSGHYANIVSELMRFDSALNITSRVAVALTTLSFDIAKRVYELEPIILYKWEDIYGRDLLYVRDTLNPEEDSVLLEIAEPSVHKSGDGYAVTIYSKWNDTRIHRSEFLVTRTELRLTRDTVLGKRGWPILTM